jgi:hypothetical protein
MMTECAGIHCTERDLSEIDSGKIMVTVSKEDVRRITLCYGIQAPNPTAQIIMGLLLMGTGYFPILHLIHWIQHGGVFLTLESWIIPFVVAGAWVFVSAFKRGFFLDVEENQGRKRLAFRHNPDPNELDSFVGTVEQCFGLKISRDV